MTPNPTTTSPCNAFVELVTEYLDGALPPTMLAASTPTSRSAPGA